MINTIKAICTYYCVRARTRVRTRLARMCRCLNISTDWVLAGQRQSQRERSALEDLVRHVNQLSQRRVQRAGPVGNRRCYCATRRPTVPATYATRGAYWEIDVAIVEPTLPTRVASVVHSSITAHDRLLF